MPFPSMPRLITWLSRAEASKGRGRSPIPSSNECFNQDDFNSQRRTVFMFSVNYPKKPDTNHCLKRMCLISAGSEGFQMAPGNKHILYENIFLTVI